MGPGGRSEQMYEHVSSGNLPSPETVAALVAESDHKFNSNSEWGQLQDTAREFRS